MGSQVLMMMIPLLIFGVDDLQQKMAFLSIPSIIGDTLKLTSPLWTSGPVVEMLFSTFFFMLSK